MLGCLALSPVSCSCGDLWKPERAVSPPCPQGRQSAKKEVFGRRCPDYKLGAIAALVAETLRGEGELLRSSPPHVRCPYGFVWLRSVASFTPSVLRAEPEQLLLQAPGVLHLSSVDFSQGTGIRQLPQEVDTVPLDAQSSNTLPSDSAK
ncbi:hypothetical protein H920_04679 [Fukomys damarensis]|uniref:Uncharacterized protein n=1 Tax=Fukomys damarensis TaxID=885580 RepID=A0A091DP43_FUKDA|nr:hypothetical protein H920_04679 [Fukomys damarensis]